MKVQFFTICHVTPHFETELEIAQTHLEKGDTVYFLVCKGNLQTCLNNPEHLKSICVKCNSTVRNGIKLLESKNVILIDYPKIDLDYSIIPDEFTDIEELKKFKIDGTIELGLGVASSLISLHNREHKLNTKEFKFKIYRELCTSYYLYKVFTSYIIPKVNPELLYIFNGRFSTTWPIVCLCKKINLPFFTHDRSGKFGNYVLVENTIPQDFNYYIDEIENSWINGVESKYEIGSCFYIERRNKIVQGWYSYTTDQNVNYLPESLSKKRKNIAIFNSTIEEYAAIKGCEKFLYIFDDEIDALRSILTAFRNDTQKYFYLRVHPNLKGYNNTQTSDLYNLENEFNNVEIIRPESKIDTYALLENSDIIIVLGSTVGIESVYWGKPVIQLGLSLYNHLDVVYIPNSLDQLLENINCDLKPKNNLGAIKYGYWELTHGIPYKYFVQDSIFGGKFLNKRITPSRFNYFFNELLEIRTLTDIKKLIRRRFPKKDRKS